MEKVTLSDRQQSPVLMAKIYILMGDVSKALSQLEYGYQIRFLGMVFLKNSSVLDPLKNAPRYKELMRKLNFNQVP